MRTILVASGLLGAALAVASPASAQIVDASLIDGPPAPAPPAVMARDAEGRTTVRAIRLDDGISLDGVLDDPVYDAVPAITDFIQHVPDNGAPATERTEAWIMFDDTNVYVSARLWDSAPRSQWVANEMRRDTAQLRENDNFGAFFDAFYDRRNGFMFYANPLGGRADQQFTNEGNPNADWNPVWDVRTGRFDGGWTIEMEIPFKTFRYRSEPPHVWGIQLRRGVRRKNEYSYLTHLPIGLEEGRVVPIVGGARVTGKVGPFDVGALNIQAGDEMGSRSDPTNFTVVRLRRDILRRSSVGAMFTNRSVSRVAPGSSQAYGVDGTFALFENVNVITYLARTRVPGPDHRGKDASYQGVVDYAADRYGLRVEHLVVEDNFLPEVGFLRRDNFRRSYVSGRFSPRPQSIESVRQFSLEGSVDYIVTADQNHLETRQNLVTFQTELESSDRLLFTASDNYELLVRPFTLPGAGFSIPVGGYGFADAQVAYVIGQHRGQVQPAVPVLTPASVPPYRARARRYSRRPEAGVAAARSVVAAAVEVDQGGAW